MCSILGSYSSDKITELAKLNEYRGTYSHSITYIDNTLSLLREVKTGLGPLPYDSIIIPDNHYCIVHQQAPTADNYNDNIHPASIDGQLLWHNGIIKEYEIKRLQSLYNVEYVWDTKLLLKQLIELNTPNNIDGSFSCVWYYKNNINIFRNEISPLFLDSEMNMSSTKFENSYPIEPNCIFKLDIENKNIINKKDSNFNTVENPYYFGE
jgi:glucosamine 6-phosphate synthetase-like amidotransferase/phosphosugar isomerase protein